MAEEVKTEPVTADPEPEGVIEIPAEAGAKQKIVAVTAVSVMELRRLLGLAKCHPTISTEERRARLRIAIDSEEREIFREIRCRDCGTLWFVNQWHPQGELFSCADATTLADYEQFYGE